MGIKKIARPINKAKNTFVKWLKDHDAESIDEFEGVKSDEWDYYRTVDAFIGESLYCGSFQIWKGNIKIDYSDEENRHNDMSVDEFLQLITP